MIMLLIMVKWGEMVMDGNGGGAVDDGDDEGKQGKGEKEKDENGKNYLEGMKKNEKQNEYEGND